MDNVRKLHPQDNVDHNESEANSYGPGVMFPDFGGAVQLHHCPCVNVEKVKKYLGHEVLRLIDCSEMLEMSPFVNVQ